MSDTFKPGDRVRRTSTHASGLYPSGYEFTVEKVNGTCIYEAGEVSYAHNPANLDLVTPAPVEFQVGDRVRATAKQGDDFAEFAVGTVGSDYLESERNYFSGDEWDFELLSRPEPPKPPLPTRLGSVVRITEFGGFRQDYVALLTAGGWHVHTDTIPYKNLEYFSQNNPEFELIYEPEN